MKHRREVEHIVQIVYYLGGVPGASRQPARFNGVLVGFGYNSARGCGRIAPGTTAARCQDASGTFFAHVCNAYVKSKGDYCFAAHPKHKNH